MGRLVDGCQRVRGDRALPRVMFGRWMGRHLAWGGCMMGLPLLIPATGLIEGNGVIVQPMAPMEDVQLVGIDQPLLLAQAVPIPEAMVTPVNNQVAITLINQTGATVAYEVVGQTETRTLRGSQTVTLSNLDIPTSLLFRREDNGLLKVTLESDRPAGFVKVVLSYTEDFAVDRTTLSIDQQGGITVD